MSNMTTKQRVPADAEPEYDHIRRQDGNGTDYCDACDWTADDSLSDAEADASWVAAHPAEVDE